MQIRVIKSIGIFLLLFVLEHKVLTAQTTTEILKKYRTHPSLEVYDQYAKELNDVKFKVPILEEISLRTQSNRNDISQQDYAIRTVFNGIGQNKYYAQTKTYHLEKNKLERQELEKKILTQTYASIVSWYFLTKENAIIDSLILYQKKRLEEMVKIVSTGTYVDPQDILKIEEELYNLNHQRQENKIDAERLSLELGLQKGIASFQDWKPLETIVLEVSKIQYDGHNPIEDKRMLLESNRIYSEYKVKKTNDHRLLDYAQLGYRARNNLELQDQFSLGLGLRLPYKGSSIKNKNDHWIKKHELNLQETIKIDARKEEAEKLKNQVRSSYEKIKYLKETTSNIFKTINTKNAEVYKSTFQYQTLVNLQSKRKLLSEEKFIYKNFIDLIALTGSIYQDPKVNFLSTINQGF